MHILKRIGLVALPVAATIAAASLASADQLIAYLEGTGLSQGTRSFNCNFTGSGGRRAHIQARARGEDRYNLEYWVAYSVASGTSQSTPVYYPGKRHIAYLESHLLDTGTGDDFTVQHCTGGWTSGWASSGNTNVSQCSSNIRSSTGQYGGSCSTRTFRAYSLANTNPAN